MAELKAISRWKYRGSIIIIDDYPTFEYLINWLGKAMPDMKYTINKDLLVIK